MGNLTPNTTYIYERANGVTYSREFGADTRTRKAIGWDLDGIAHDIPLDNFKEDRMWFDIREAAQSNPALQDVLDKAVLIYKLSKKYRD